MEHSMEWVELTRDQAAEFLAATSVKRSVRSAAVERYRRDMDSGVWRFRAAAPLFVLPSGAVGNGVHRLSAFLASGLEVFPTWVQEVEAADLVAADIGMSRSLSDLLDFEGFEHTRELSALYNTSYKWATGDSTIRVPMSERVRWIRDNPNAVKSAAAANATERGTGSGTLVRVPLGTVAAMADIAAHAEGVDSVTEFVRGVATGTVTSSAVSRLQAIYADHRNARSSTRVSPTQLSYLAVRVYVSWLNEENLSKLYATKKVLRDLPGWGSWMPAVWPEVE